MFLGSPNGSFKLEPYLKPAPVHYSGTTPPPQTVQPTVAAISPTNVPAGSRNFILTIIGTGLGMTSQVKFGRGVLMPSSATPTNCPAAGSCVALSVNVPAQ